MRILHVSDVYLPRRGGVERVIEALAREQAAAGDEPMVLTRRLAARDPGRDLIGEVPVQRIGRALRPAPLHYAEVVASSARWARRELGRFDVVHAHLTLTALALSSPVLRGPRPLVASFYGPWASEYEYEFGPQGFGAGSSPLGAVWRRALAGFMRRAQGRVLGRAARVIALSRHSAAELGQFGYNGPGKVKVIPGGVDLARFQQLERGAPTGPATVILSVRRLVPRMGLELLLDAHALLRRRRGDIELRIVGDGALRAALEERASALEGVRLLGRVDDAELAAQYAGADLVIMPTRALEGFGLPVVEAWACGTPVVATPVGSLPELVSRADRRFLARAASAEALAEAAGWALDEPRARWSERLRALAGSYSWSRIAAETRTTYEEALEDAGQR